MKESTAWIIVFGFLIISLILVFIIIIQKFVNLRHLKKEGVARDYLFQKYFDLEDQKMSFSSRFFIDAFIDVETQVQIEADVRKVIIEDLIKTKFIKKQIKRINSIFLMRRKQSIYYLSYLGHQQFQQLLKDRFDKEKNESLRFQILYSFKDHLEEKIFYLAMKSLMGSSTIYRSWLMTMFKNRFEQIKSFIKPYLYETQEDIAEFFVGISSATHDLEMKEFALRLFHKSAFSQELKYKALRFIAEMHPDVITSDDFCKHGDDEVKKIAILAAGNVVTKDMLDHLLSSIDGSKNDLYRIKSLSRIVFDSKQLLLDLMNQYPKVSHIDQKKAIAKVMSNRMDYMMLKLKDQNFPFVKDMIELMMNMHITEDFIDFANHNKDQKIEEELIKIIKKYIVTDSYLMNEFSTYLNQDILSKIGIMKKAKPFSIKEKTPFEKRKVIWIIMWIIFSILALPFIFFLTHIKDIIYLRINIFELMIVNINRYLVFYFMSVNSIYLLLLILSIKGSSDRLLSWKIKTKTFLYEHGLMPSISIIAPAYNEEKSIIESVTSLLNLKYPTYEVIVVNDGSKDQTLDVLINHFQLERKHPFFTQVLPTKGLRGVYLNRKIPNLIVLDKQNGGKADALNLGINAAKNQYVCGIDADSLLEEDALIKLMSITLDDTKNYIAIGGNIVPVNDSIVDKGKVELTRLGKKGIVRFQTLEYLRAFTTGRIGWAKLKSLMIISGAFGIFNRAQLLETGGYLTISGALKKDTVGEDMELVVRLTYQALKEKKKYRVDYVHHANCYTELPSDYISLFKQRNRWQRGLLDILSYHRQMLFNPKYKQPGLIAFPYFFIFEMMGPFIEMMGYAALIVGVSIGILNLPIVLILFAATIGYGIVISLFSLWISERKTRFYTVKETFILIWIAIIENIGYRQMMSLHRIISTFSALRESGNWGSQSRVGFQKTGEST